MCERSFESEDGMIIGTTSSLPAVLDVNLQAPVPEEALRCRREEQGSRAKDAVGWLKWVKSVLDEFSSRGSDGGLHG